MLFYLLEYSHRLETKNMRQMIFAILTLALLATAACNTVHGLGRDVERVGEETQDGVNSVRRRM
jgi:predicted small secreted protein